MRGRARGSGDGEEKRLMKNEDFREQTAFSIYIVCLIKIFDSGKGAEHMSKPRNFFLFFFLFYDAFCYGNFVVRLSSIYLCWFFFFS